MRSPHIKIVVVSMLAALAVACSSSPPDPSSPAELESRRMLDRLAIGDVQSVASRFPADFRTADTLAKIHQMVILFPQGSPKDVHLVGFEGLSLSNAEGTRQTSRVSLESEYESAHLMTQFLWRGSEQLELIAVQVQPLPASLESLNRFTLRGKGIGHYAFLIAVPAVLGTMGYALYVWFAARSRLRRRWVLLVALFLGIPSWNLNWTTGGWSFQPLRAQLFCLGGLKQTPYSPWIFSCSVPLGALLFLLMRRRWIVREETGPLGRLLASGGAVGHEEAGP